MEWNDGHIKDITGEVTAPYGYRLLDLGIPRWDEARGCYALVFGDSFPIRLDPDDPGWISPTIICYDPDMNPIGVPASIDGHPVVDPNGRARQLWEYRHNNPEFSTVLPTDFIRLGEWWYVHVMVTRELGDEAWTEFQRSKDLVTWEHTGKYLAPADPIATMLTFEQVGEWVYVMGTGGLTRNKPIFLWRVWAEAFPHGDWEPWGWRPTSGWEWGNDPTPILPGLFGELCVRRCKTAAGEDRLLLSFFDAERYEVAALVAEGPESNWMRAPRTVVARGHEVPQLYGGYWREGCSLDKGEFVVSQWRTIDNSVYKSSLFGAAVAESRRD